MLDKEKVTINEKEDDSIEKILNGISMVKSAITQNIIGNMMQAMKKVGESLSKIASSEYMQSIKDSLIAFSQAIDEAYNNPYSYMNFYDYQEKLNSFHWAWPYEISPSELRCLLEQVNNEREFDRLLASFFDKERLNSMMDFISGSLPRKHKVIFRQIRGAFFEKKYALINNAAISISDNLLSVVLKDK